MTLHIADILFFSSDELCDSKSNRFHVARHLSHRFRIIFVERQFLTILSVLKKPIRILNFIRMFRPLRKSRNLIIVTLPLSIPGNLPIVKQLNRLILAKHLKWCLNKIGVKSYLTWVVSPFQLDLLKCFPGRFSVYHCHDGYAYYPNANVKEVIYQETEIKRIVDIVFYSSKYLHSIGGYLGKSFYVGHGCDSIFLDLTKYQIPYDIKHIPKPIVGFHGILNFHTDESLLHNIAKTFPSISFVFVGPVASCTAHLLDNYPNFYFLGQKEFPELPSYLKCFDLAILPYKKIPMSDACSPLKLYEYLACGIPILSTDIRECHVHEEYLYIAKDCSEFSDFIPRLLSTKHDFSRQKAYAQRHLWSNKIEQMIRLIDEKLQGE